MLAHNKYVLDFVILVSLVKHALCIYKLHDSNMCITEFIHSETSINRVVHHQIQNITGFRNPNEPNCKILVLSKNTCSTVYKSLD